MKRIFLGIILTLVLPCTVAFAAYSKDLVLSPSNVTFTKNSFTEGTNVRIYVHVENEGTIDALGAVRFFNSNQGQLGHDQVISAVASKTDTVFMDFTPTTIGEQKIQITVIPSDPANDNPNNNYYEQTINVLRDSDRDGIPNINDSDNDNDGVPDSEDAFPLNYHETFDTDNDGTGDNADSDDDNDGVMDTEDDFPLNPTEWTDTDNDSIGDNSDSDIDGDSIPNTAEIGGGTNPTSADSDSDGHRDNQDSFPTNPKEYSDFDKDSIGDNADLDDDNDKIPDLRDDFPHNKGPVIIMNEQPKIGAPDDELVFDASPSYDEDGTITSYEWKVKLGDRDIPVGKQPIFKYTFVHPGDYQVSLTTKDNSGEERSSFFSVRIFQYSSGIVTFVLILVIFLATSLFLRYSKRT